MGLPKLCWVGLVPKDSVEMTECGLMRGWGRARCAGNFLIMLRTSNAGPQGLVQVCLDALHPTTPILKWKSCMTYVCAYRPVFELTLKGVPAALVTVNAPHSGFSITFGLPAFF